MKLASRPNRSRPRSAFASVVVLTMLALMALLLAINADSVKQAFREVRLVEERQAKQPWLTTNAPVPAPPKP